MARKSHPVSRRRGRKKQTSESADFGFLDEFAEGVALDEISFATWQQVHRSLDLHIPMFLTAAEAEQGGEREIRYQRVVLEHEAGRAVRHKEKRVVLVSWPALATDGSIVVIKSGGDKDERRAGKLEIIIKIK